MPDDFSIDTREFDRAIADLMGAPAEVLGGVRAAVSRNLALVKSSWQGKLRGNEYAPRAPYSISYETKELAHGVSGEVGANKGTGQQGGVVLLLEYGAPARGLSPRGYGAASLAENLDDLERGIGIALDDGLRKVGW